MAACLVPRLRSQISMQTLIATPRRLRLASHVCACESDGQVILLDLRRNKYFGVAGRHSPALADVVDGWPASAPAEGESLSVSDIDSLTRPLLLKGLLTPRPLDDQAVERRVAQPLADLIDQATISLEADDAIDAATVGDGRVYRMVQSAAVAAMWLRWRSLLWIAEAVAGRRTRLEQRRARPSSPEAMRAAVAAYAKLRPLVFTARDRCLHDSLALVGFLAAEGMFPRWVIGIQTQPFGAHSWVQSGGTVLNDHPDRVRRFRPILVV